MSKSKCVINKQILYNCIISAMSHCHSNKLINIKTIDYCTINIKNPARHFCPQSQAICPPGHPGHRYPVGECWLVQSSVMFGQTVGRWCWVGSGILHCLMGCQKMLQPGLGDKSFCMKDLERARVQGPLDLLDS